MHTFITCHLLEILASITGLINLWLVTRGRQLNWLFGIITVSLYFVIFLKVRLYADMTLQLIFLSLQFYGLYQWRHAKTHTQTLIVRRLSPAERFKTLALTLILYALIAFILQRYTHSTLIWMDSLVTALSLIAQWKMAERFIEHWLIWMLVDVISVVLYLQKSLFFSSGLYAVYFIFCIQGYWLWKKYLNTHSPRLPAKNA